MSDLSVFYAQNVSGLTEDLIVSERFKDKDGKPVPWKLRSMTEEENESIRKSATKRVQAKRGMATQETDPTEYMVKLAVASVVYPNLKDAELQKSYGVMGSENLLRKMLLAGEYAALIEKIQELNAFDKNMNELVEEAKN